ncbi:MAG: winged helix-turn-helix domain-containing protein [Desulfobulbaceae bacterium]|uniref:Winged helix-turn-helix domain-containing protein n=1 Tax=Candidatus Desulfobia pelagia TaxID=2841692 RepID=A0A8J6TFJ9_9BACT|nr:winged helix-turn-helix domain-containing protein [Candidatus Desulfobia pelagia]
MPRKSKQKKNRINGISSCWRGRLWLDGPEGTFLGYGRIVLLERIEEFGSISKAARSMEMSYKHAWDLLDSMNRQSSDKLVETFRGGKDGGGARLTEAGRQAVKLFWKVHAKFQCFLDQETAELKEILGENGPDI